MEKVGQSTKRLALRVSALIAGTLSCGVFLGASLATADPLKAAMLLPGSINDQSWNAAGYAGLLKIKASGFEIAYSENVPDADDAEAMSDYARRGFQVVMGHGGQYQSAAMQVGPQFPNTQFIIGSGSGFQKPNVMSIDYAEEQFGCLLGVLAARMSKTGKVGGVYGLEGLATIIAQAGGFRVCAKKTRPDIQVTFIYVKDMEDAAAAKEAALSLIADGADVITGKLNAAQSGVVQAAKEKGVFATGRSIDAVETARNAVLTNIVEFWDDMYSQAAIGAKNGKLTANFIAYGYDTADKTTGAALMYSKTDELNPLVPPDVVAELEGVKKKFASGEMKLVPTANDARGGK
jgi:basic membrane protein A and related proteins